MAPPHKDCGNECLQCVLDWYYLGSSQEESEDSFSGSSGASGGVKITVPDLVSPSDLGNEVGDSEFNDASSEYVPNTPGFTDLGSGSEAEDVHIPGDHVCDPKKPVCDCKPLDPEPNRVDSEAESPSTKRFNAYVKRFMDRRNKSA